MAPKSLSIPLHFFLPMLGVFVSIVFGHHLVLSVKQQIVDPNFHLWIYGLTAAIFLSLITIARFYSVHQICFAFFLAAPVLLGCSIPLTTVNPEIYHLIITFWFWGSFFFFWAYANNHFSFRQAGLYYPIFILIMSAAHLILPPDLFSGDLIDLGILITISSLGVLLFYLYTFFRLKQIQHEEDARGPKIDPMFLLYYRFIIGGIVFSLTILAILDKQFGLETVQPMWTLFVIAACPFLSGFLYLFRGTSWRFIAYALLFSIVVTYWSPLPMISLLAPIVLILKEMSFIAVPKCSRFLTKTWVDIFFLGCGLFVGHVLFLIPEPALQGVIIAAMILFATTIHLAGVRLETFCK